MADVTERAGAAREFGRDGVSGMVDRDRALRARRVSQPSEDDVRNAERVVEDLIARGTARRPDRR